MKYSKIGMAEGGWTRGKFRSVWCCKFLTVVGWKVEEVSDQDVYKNVKIIGVEIFLGCCCGEH